MNTIDKDKRTSERLKKAGVYLLSEVIEFAGERGKWPSDFVGVIDTGTDQEFEDFINLPATPGRRPDGWRFSD